MAVFRPSNKTCELNFDDKFVYNLPLHEDVADKIGNAAEKLKSHPMKNKSDIDGTYNTALDVLDEILGEGEAENVMSIYEKPGTLEAIEVVMFIVNQYKAEYAAEVERMKATAQPQNREQRRAGRR